MSRGLSMGRTVEGTELLTLVPSTLQIKRDINDKRRANNANRTGNV